MKEASLLALNRAAAGLEDERRPPRLAGRPIKRHRARARWPHGGTAGPAPLSGIVTWRDETPQAARSSASEIEPGRAEARGQHARRNRHA